MYVKSDSLDDEIRITVDAAVEIANVLALGPGDGDGASRTAMAQRVLIEHDFLRARRATAHDMDDVVDRFAPVAALVVSLPGAPVDRAVAQINTQLDRCDVAPSLSAHDGFPLHIHWTTTATSFADQVAVDVLMALSQTLCDHGTVRFGRCAADDCDRVFYDASKNGSRRFCSDPRCASRTHTAAHRARHRGG